MTLAVAVVAAVGGPASAAPSGADRFCAELHRIVDAGAQAEPFAQLQRNEPAPPTLGFIDGCGVEGAGLARIWRCSQSHAPDGFSIQSLAAQTAACLPQARRAIFATWRETQFQLPGAIIRIREDGAAEADGGRIVSYSVEPIDVPASSAAPSG